MEQMTAREQVLKAIRDAQIEGKVSPVVRDVDFDHPIYHPIQPDNDTEALAVYFARKMDVSGGYFIYCDNIIELVESIKTVIQDRNFSPVFTNDPKIELLFTQTEIAYNHQPEELTHARVVVSFCEALVARYGVVSLSSSIPCGAIGNAFPDIRFIIAFPEQLVENMADVSPILHKKYGSNFPSMISFISGPSCTHALDFKNITGIHGNRELYVFYVNSTPSKSQ